MDVLTDKPQHIGIDNKPAAERDRIDANMEMAGVQNSRIKRFLSNEFTGANGESKEKKAERQFQTMLDILLAQDAQYAAFHHQFSQKLDKAYQAVDIALVEINQNIELSANQLEILRDNAHQLEDGTIVFKSSNNGNIYLENGNRLNTDINGAIKIPDNAPSWEVYQFEKDAFSTAKQQKLEVETYRQDVLDHAQERLNDANNPALMDELIELDEQFLSDMPGSASKFYNNASSDEPEPIVNHKTEYIDNLNSGFKIPNL